MAEFYTVNGMVLESRKRREHLTEEDLQKNRLVYCTFKSEESISQKRTCRRTG